MNTELGNLVQKYGATVADVRPNDIGPTVAYFLAFPLHMDREMFVNRVANATDYAEWERHGDAGLVLYTASALTI